MAVRAGLLTVAVELTVTDPRPPPCVMIVWTVNVPADKLRRGRGRRRLSGSDRVVVILMVTIPTLLVLWLVWFLVTRRPLLAVPLITALGVLASMGAYGVRDVRTLAGTPDGADRRPDALAHANAWLKARRAEIMATPAGLRYPVFFVTSDGGQHWAKLTPSANFKRVALLDFVLATTGWALGDQGRPTARSSLVSRQV